VEETRQHSALKPDSFTFAEIGLAIVGGLGALAAVAGVVLHFIVGGRSILLGFLAFTLSRALMRLWQLARPHAFPRNHASSTITTALAILWVFLSLLLSIPFWPIS
jgi:hypothetical protein